MGGSYFIGKRIAEFLIQKGHSITVLNRGTKKNVFGANCLICDRNINDEIEKALQQKQFDAVVDVSCLNGMQAEKLTAAIDTKSLKKLIFISSSAVYDIENLRPPYKEDNLGYNKYWRDYGENKIDAEKVYSDWAHKYGISTVVLRPPYVYGEENYAQRESFVFDHIDNKCPILIPENDFKLQFIYSGDLAMVISHLLEIDTGLYSVYNVGNKKEITVRQWIEYCFMVTGKKVEIIAVDYKKYGKQIRDFFPFYDYDNYLDVSKINSIYDIETDMTDGLKNAYGWYVDTKESIFFNEKVKLNEKQIIEMLKAKL